MSISQQRRQEAIDFFVKIGLLIPFDSLELYHGRSRKPGEDGEWVVDPNFNNSNNATGNGNINGIPALSTGEKSLAEKFAKERSRYSGTPELHKIESTIDNALILNRGFDFRKLTPEETRKYLEYAKWLNPNVSKYAPVDFEYRDKANTVYNVINEYWANVMRKDRYKYFSYKDVDKIFEMVVAKDPSITKDLVIDIVGAANAKVMLQVNPASALTHFAITREKKDRERFDLPGSIEKGPLNLDYIASWAKSIGVVGVKSSVSSATLDEDIEAYYIFDLNSINTRAAKAQKLVQIMDNYSGIVDLLGDVDKGLQFLVDKEPEEIMDTLQNDKRFDKLFQADAKVWERFSVGEHTETCLRLFDSSIAQEMPKELHPYMRLAIICHDIGKGMPREDGKTQLDNNLKYAYGFMESLGVPKKVGQIVWTIMAAQRYTSDYYIHGNKNAENSLFLFLTTQLQKIYGIAPSDEQVKGLMSMCKALQICDSGAYTRYGVTRDKKTGKYYKNGNDRFTSSFEEPTNTTKDKLRFKSDPNM